jgi:hypothetical protein
VYALYSAFTFEFLYTTAAFAVTGPVRARPVGDTWRGCEGELVVRVAEKLKKKNFSRNTQKGVDIFLCMCYNNVIKEKENPKMNSKQIVAEVMNLRGWSQKKLAEKLGYATVTGVANRLNGKNTKDMNVATLVEFLSLMECEVVVRSTTKDKKEWVISLDEKEGE